MNTRTLIVVCMCVFAAGCSTTSPVRKPRWEIVINANVEYKPDHFTTTKAGVEFKRPLQATAITATKK